MTIAGGSADLGSGLWSDAGSAADVRVAGTVFDNPGDDCRGYAITSLGWNRSSDTSCSLGAASDLSGVDAELGPLGGNGGPTLTRLPSATS